MCNSPTRSSFRQKKPAGYRWFPRIFRTKSSKKRSSSSLDDTSDTSVGSTMGTDVCDLSATSSCPEGTPDKFSQPEDAATPAEEMDADGLNRIKPMMARLDALQIQQQMQGMNHPDVLFALKHHGRAHRRRGDLQEARLLGEMLQAACG
jgi:hypothetical protein